MEGHYILMKNNSDGKKLSGSNSNVVVHADAVVSDNRHQQSQLMLEKLNDLYSSPIKVKSKLEPNVKLNSIYANYTISELTAVPSQSESKAPINLIILFAIFLMATYFFCVEKYEVLHASLPNSIQPIFVKIVGPLADEKPVQAKQAQLAHTQYLEQEQQTNATKEVSDQYVNIEGTLMKYNPHGEYIINGKIVISHLKPGSNR
jgi:hypothetical protein